MPASRMIPAALSPVAVDAVFAATGALVWAVWAGLVLLAARLAGRGRAARSGHLRARTPRRPGGAHGDGSGEAAP
jgi:hypothetical protein